ncbi:MAG: AAA+ family ATPase [Gemmobacter sp.]
MRPMLLIAPACLMLTLAPIRAQEATPPDDGFGRRLIEEGAEMLLRGLMSEAEPMLDEMGQAFREIEPRLRTMGPQLKLLVELMGDGENYDAPERMPNGDILIRRRAGAPPAPALPDLPLPLPRQPETGRLIPEGEIEL